MTVMLNALRFSSAYKTERVKWYIHEDHTGKTIKLHFEHFLYIKISTFKLL